MRSLRPGGLPAPLSAPLRAPQIEEKAADLQTAIQEGAISFLFTEYKYVSIFMVRRSRSDWCKGQQRQAGPGTD